MPSASDGGMGARSSAAAANQWSRDLRTAPMQRQALALSDVMHKNYSKCSLVARFTDLHLLLLLFRPRQAAVEGMLH